MKYANDQLSQSSAADQQNQNNSNGNVQTNGNGGNDGDDKRKKTSSNTSTALSGNEVSQSTNLGDKFTLLQAEGVVSGEEGKIVSTNVTTFNGKFKSVDVNVLGVTGSQDVDGKGFTFGI
jgi:hypothetical protein